MNVLGLVTSSNRGADHESWGSSAEVLSSALEELELLGFESRLIDAGELHIVGNLSCYASGGRGCADPAAGPWRCWAHKVSAEDPKAWGGVDEMPAVYEGIEWADVVLVSTSVRWGSHTAVLQSVIERLNTLENRHSVYGERNPCWGKKLGVIVTGQHWMTQRVAQQLLDTFGLIGFDAGRNSMFTWQRTNDMRQEQVGPNVGHVKSYLATPRGRAQLDSFIDEVLGARL